MVSIRKITSFIVKRWLFFFSWRFLLYLAVAAPSRRGADRLLATARHHPRPRRSDWLLNDEEIHAVFSFANWDDLAADFLEHALSHRIGKAARCYGNHSLFFGGGGAWRRSSADRFGFWTGKKNTVLLVEKRFDRVSLGFVALEMSSNELHRVFSRPLLGFIGFYWVLLGLPGFTGFYRVFTGFYWILLGFTGFYWVSLGFTGFNRVL